MVRPWGPDVVNALPAMIVVDNVTVRPLEAYPVRVLKLLPVPIVANCIVEPAVMATPARFVYCKRVTAAELTGIVVV